MQWHYDLAKITQGRHKSLYPVYSNYFETKLAPVNVTVSIMNRTLNLCFGLLDYKKKTKQ